MSMTHKAYALDWDPFQTELRPILERALKSGRTTKLVAFIEANRKHLTSFWTEEPIGEDWRDEIETPDVQQLGDLALTKYYDLQADDGLAHAWLLQSDSLPAAAQRAVLGTPLGEKEGRYFDPGKYGSYFQSPDEVSESLAVLAAVRKPALGEYAEDFARFRALLRRCAKSGNGLYVTF